MSHRAASTRPLAVTVGDPAGTGPDVCLAAWCKAASALSSGVPVLSAFAVISCPAMLAARAEALGLNIPIQKISALQDAPEVFPQALPVLALTYPFPVEAGCPVPGNAAAIIMSIRLAVHAISAGTASGLVTGPIAKHIVSSADFHHPGHTEFLGELAGTFFPDAPSRAPVMLMSSAELKVVPVTVHVPLEAVPRLLTRERLEATLLTVANAMVRDFGVPRPRIAVAGLNPHAGEAGLLGSEERDVISPVVEALRARGLDVRGPLSADTMFHAQARATYDVAVTMYHDQGLIPIKTLAFDTGVNATVGLPFVRTSPDHGTAFELAGTGRASAASFIEAVLLAQAMVENRARCDGGPAP